MRGLAQRFLAAGATLLVLAALVTVFRSDVIAQAVKAALTKNVDEPGRTNHDVAEAFGTGGCDPYYCTDFHYTPGGSNALSTISFKLYPSVPAGKRWVVRSVSGFLPTGSQSWISLTGGHTGYVQWRYFGPFFALPPNATLSGFSTETFITFNPGEAPAFEASFMPSGNNAGEVELNGYLIDASN